MNNDRQERYDNMKSYYSKLLANVQTLSVSECVCICVILWGLLQYVFLHSDFENMMEITFEDCVICVLAVLIQLSEKFKFSPNSLTM